MNSFGAKQRLSNCVLKTDTCKLLLATAIYDCSVLVNWKNTPYKSYADFCKKEVSLSQASIYRYLKTAKLMVKYHYSLKQLRAIVEDIGWCRLQIGLSTIKKRITHLSFVARFKDINLNARVKFEDDPSDLVKFSFSIPKDHAEILTAELVANGMRETNKSRTNSSAAMVKIINKFAEENWV
jgi:hypothetical protein